MAAVRKSGRVVSSHAGYDRGHEGDATAKAFCSVLVGGRKSSAIRPWPAANDGALNGRAMTLALRRLQQLTDAWHEIDPSDAIRQAVIRFLRVHPLRTPDALQLAAAFVAAERRPHRSKWLRSMTVLPMPHAGRVL